MTHGAVNYQVLRGNYEIGRGVHVVNTTERKFRRLWNPGVEARIRAEAHSLDEQIVPKEVKFCIRCVVSNQRPRIVFNEEGVCSACLYAERKKTSIDWLSRESELRTLLDKHRRPSGYDVIVPCSGGKDSSFVAHTLKHEYGMNPLCVKFAPFIYTDIGRKNFESFVQSGFDCLVAWPNGLIHRKLARLAFEYLGDPFQPFVFGQLCYPVQMSRRFGIPLIFGGENAESEYGGDPSADNKHGWDYADWERIYLKGAGVDKLINLGIELGAISQSEVREISEFYKLPKMELTNIPEYHWLGYYKKWHPMENFYFSAEHTGFQPNTERSEGTYSKLASLDDKMDGLHYKWSHVKFGIGRATSDAAQQIRAGDITREEGLALVKRFDGEKPTRYLAECLDYLGLDEKQLEVLEKRFSRHVSMAE